MPITEGGVLHIARLARLTLTEEEVKIFTRQLGKILEYMGKLNELDSSGIEPTAHAISLSNVMRDDRATSSPDVEGILKNAPDREKDLLRVPRIIED